MTWKIYFEAVSAVALLRLSQTAKLIPLLGEKIAAPLDALGTVIFFDIFSKRPRDNPPHQVEKEKK